MNNTPVYTIDPIFINSIMIYVYTKPGCQRCNATFRRFDNLDCEVIACDIDDNDDARQEAEKLGYTELPIVAVYNNKGDLLESWSGFRPDAIDDLVSRRF